MRFKHHLIAFFAFCLCGVAQAKTTMLKLPTITPAINNVVQPFIEMYKVPGIAIAISIDGKNYFFNYGAASLNKKEKVTENTLFDIGSVAQLFAATLAAFLHEIQEIHLSHATAEYIPTLAGTSFAHISLINLATHTSGLPLSLPENIKDTAQFLDYLQHWNPPHPVGSRRIYSDVGVGLLGLALAKNNQVYEALVNKDIFIPLELSSTYFYSKVPKYEDKHIAQGYTSDDRPVREPNELLLPAAYGLLSDSRDLIHLVNANLHTLPILGKFQHAINDTQIGYYKTDYVTQDLIWEQYHYPVSLTNLLRAHAHELNATAEKLNPPLPQQIDSYIDDTGTGLNGGTSVYIAFIPKQKIGLVILANKYLPMSARVTLGYELIAKIIELRQE